MLKSKWRMIVNDLLYFSFFLLTLFGVIGFTGILRTDWSMEDSASAIVVGGLGIFLVFLSEHQRG